MDNVIDIRVKKQEKALSRNRVPLSRDFPLTQGEEERSLAERIIRIKACIDRINNSMKKLRDLGPIESEEPTDK